MDNYIKLLEDAVIKLLEEADDWCFDSRGHEATDLEAERALAEEIKVRRSVAESNQKQ